MSTLEAQRDVLFQEWTRKPAKNNKTIDSILENLKLVLSQVSFHQDDINVASLIHCRDVLEIGAFFSIETQQVDSFERYLSQLKVYYFDYRSLAGLPESANKYQLLGLNLLRLLSQNRLAEFHTELELLEPDIIQSNVFISHPVLLEQYLMEGSYNKVFLAKSQIPSPYYTFFMDVLLETIRDQIASCLESAFYSIAVTDILRLLFLETVDGLKKYLSPRKWVLSADGRFVTFPPPNDSTELLAKVASQQIASQIIEYAVELEKIV